MKETTVNRFIFTALIFYELRHLDLLRAGNFYKILKAQSQSFQTKVKFWKSAH